MVSVKIVSGNPNKGTCQVAIVVDLKEHRYTVSRHLKNENGRWLGRGDAGLRQLQKTKRVGVLTRQGKCNRCGARHKGKERCIGGVAFTETLLLEDFSELIKSADDYSRVFAGFLNKI